jgi:hypothetical protein
VAQQHTRHARKMPSFATSALLPAAAPRLAAAPRARRSPRARRATVTTGALPDDDSSLDSSLDFSVLTKRMEALKEEEKSGASATVQIIVLDATLPLQRLTLRIPKGGALSPKQPQLPLHHRRRNAWILCLTTQPTVVLQQLQQRLASQRVLPAIPQYPGGWQMLLTMSSSACRTLALGRYCSPRHPTHFEPSMTPTTTVNLSCLGNVARHPGTGRREAAAARAYRAGAPRRRG